MLYLADCGTGNIIELYASEDGNLAPYTRTTINLVTATYLGYYPQSMESSDQCLIGWREPQAGMHYTTKIPSPFSLGARVINAQDYKYFRWCGKGRYVHRDLGPDKIGPALPSTGLKPGELSPIHAPGWHQCKCGFRNQDISITAIIAGKYVCYQCRNIWKK